MKTTGKTFRIDYRGQSVLVEIYVDARREVFLVSLPSPLFLTETLDGDNNPFWTSVPEGRLQEATEIGILIENRHLKEQSKPQTLF